MMSGIQHYCFCPRQWALIHIEQLWIDNYHTALGEIIHERAHDQTVTTRKNDIISKRDLRVISHRLQFSGVCDVVEFTPSMTGTQIPEKQGLWTITPIEYKKGKPKTHSADEVQLCAEAIALEDMFNTSIEYGYLFYAKTKNRSKVLFTPELRMLTSKLASEMNELAKTGNTPLPIFQSHCASCSLNEYCIPLQQKNEVHDYITSHLEDL